MSFNANGQEAHCGIATAAYTSPDNEDIVLRDRFGNGYTLEQVTVKTTANNTEAREFPECGCSGLIIENLANGQVTMNISTGYFDLFFEDCNLGTNKGFSDPTLNPLTGAPIGDERRRVLCQVYHDLAELITRNEAVCPVSDKVNIQLVPYELGDAPAYYGTDPLPVFPTSPLGGTVLAGASAYLNINYQGEINNGEPWIIINSGIRGALPNSGTPLYDGLMRYNFSENVDWFLDYNAINVPDEEYDFYGVCYHEALHMLGFHALNYLSTPQNGNIVAPLGYTSFAKNIIIEANNEHIIANNPNPSYFWELTIGDQGLNDYHSDCIPPLDGVPGTEYNTLVFETSGGSHYLVYTGPSLAYGSSYSHLQTNCTLPVAGTPQYLMNATKGKGKRHRITNEEKDILRTMGYNLGGQNDCAVGAAPGGPHFLDVNDDTPDCNPSTGYVVDLCERNVLTIFIRDLIYNDPYATNISFLQLIPSLTVETGVLIGPENIDGFLGYRYYPAQTGTFDFAYTPIGCSGEEGNNIFFEVKVIASTDLECYTACREYAACDDFSIDENCIKLLEEEEVSSCNIICNPSINGSFVPEEGVIPPLAYISENPYYADEIRLPGWTATHGSPDFLAGDINTGSGFIYMGASAGTLCAFDEETGLATFTEGVRTFVSLSPNTKYLLGFDTGNYPFSDESVANSNIQVKLLEGQELSHQPPPGLTCPTYTGELEVAILDHSITTPNNETYKAGACFTSPNNEAYNALWFYINPALLAEETNVGIRLDNVELIEDEFAINDSYSTEYCGTETTLGGMNFCMLSNLAVTYQWSAIDGNAVEAFLLSYEVENGILSNVENPDDLSFAESTRTLTAITNETTTYRLTRILPNSFTSCEDHLDMTVTVLNAAPDPGFAIQHDGCEYTFTPNTPNSSAVWVIDGETPVNGEAPNGILMTTLSNGNHTIMMTVTNEFCGSNSSTETINVDCTSIPPLTCSCPTNETSYTLALSQQGVLLSTLIGNGLPAGYTLDNCLTITGTLIINKNYTITSEVIMNANAQIIIEDGFTLTLNGANIHGCDFLWKGITNNAGSSNTPSLFCYNTSISDAKTAIKTVWASSIEIQNTIFDRNYIGVSFEKSDLSDFYGNTFSCSANLLEDLNEGVLGLQTLYGMQFSGKTVTIGTNLQARNSFRGIRNGINSVNTSVLIVINTEFENIQSSNTEDYSIMGHGIYHKSTLYSPLLYQRGFGNNPLVDDASFKDCEIAIRSKNGGNIDIRSNNMQDVKKGIEISFSQNQKIDINKNYIKTTTQGRGIELLHNDPTKHINVSFNDIDLGHKAIGIAIEEMGNPHSDAVIEDNTINGTVNTLFNKGIFMQNTNNIKVERNTVHINTIYGLIGTSSGIAIKDGQNCLFSCNKVFGSGGAATGLDVWTTLITQYSCNDFTNLHTGMKFTGICDVNSTTALKGNDFFPPFEVGLHYTASAILNTQVHKGNRWLVGNYGDVAARHDGSDIDDISNAAYEVHTTSPPFYPPSIFPSPLNVSWFLPTQGIPASCIGNPQDPGDDDCPYYYYIAGPKIDDLTKRAAKGQAVGSIYPATALWTIQKALHQNIKENPSLLGEDVFVDMFYAMAENNKMGALNAVEHNISTAWTSLTTELEQIQLLSKQLSLNITSLIEKDELIAQASTPTLLTERDNLLQSIHTQSESITTLYTTINTFRDSEAIVLKNDNTGILSTAIYENNEKAVNDIYLGTVLLGNADFTAAQKATLFSIAQQCPLAGGNPVFKARALYALVEDVEYDDDILCGSQMMTQAMTNDEVESINEDKKVEHKAFEDFHLYPNPAKDILTLEYHLAKEGQLAIFDLYGRKVMQKTLSPDNVNIQIDTERIANGVYLLKVFDADSIHFFSKVIIQH